ncbi:hypothetical protein [Methylomonas methanica]|jgi:hypothetical protein|uniref:Secreted protein n=1 Tax=Methylomonas methanica TaxID=421 RepID=A0A177MLK9_METMH|nr:hypothetical protein [Methylomonas methanica]OAI06285.1 hypothetical protein A1332_11750 [Methylomonas methanica]
MNRKLHKAIVGILGTVALAASSHANALGVAEVDLGTFTGSALAGTSTAGKKSWADSISGSNGFGWVHTGSTFAKLQVGSAAQIASGATVNLTIKMTAAATNGIDNPAFSVWTSGTSDFNLSAGGFGLHTYSQVRGPADGGVSDNASLGNIGITDFIGYSNSGGSFTNGDGDAVGAGGVSSSPWVSAIASSWASGADFSSLTLSGLKSGYYLIAAGGSCFDGTCAAGSSFNLEVTAAPVPVPAAVWLFGSAMAGLIGVGKRKRSA